MPRVHPKTWDDGIMPLDEFPDDMRAAIIDAVKRERPPARWLDFGLAQIESRAWYEWHWARGKKLRWVGPHTERRRIPDRVRRFVIERDGLICGICSGEVEPHDVHLDHIYPHSLGGSDDHTNLQVAHSLCNIRKGARV